MAIEILLEGNLKPVSDQEKFSAFLQHFCHHKQLKCEDFETGCIIEVCPEGTIECTYENDFVSILAQTNIAGPGFHAYAANFLQELIDESEVCFEVEDPTGYMEDHNFENLKYEYFYKWLSSISDYVLDHDELENLCLSWPLQYYRPQAREDCVVTPMGYIPIEDFETKEIEDLADQFFIWNDEGMNANYYLHCAINLICKECYFEYSAMNEYTLKTASSIMDYLEIAHELDASLPLPVSIYQELAYTIDRDDLLKHAVSFEDASLGYRKHTIQYEFGNWMIPIDGFSEIYQDVEHGSAQIINAYHNEDELWDWMLQLDIESKMEFDPVFMEESAFIMNSSTIQEETFEGKSITMNYGEYYEIYAQLISDNEQLTIRFRTMEVSHLKKGNDILANIQQLRVDGRESLKH